MQIKMCHTGNDCSLRAGRCEICPTPPIRGLTQLQGREVQLGPHSGRRNERLVVNEYGCGGDEMKWNELGGAYSMQGEMINALSLSNWVEI